MLGGLDLRAGIIGAGLMGGWHARTLNRLGVDLVGVVDQDLSRASLITRRFPAAASFTSLDKLLEEAAPDVVHICTPLASHEDFALRALSGGVHVVCEKPMAGSAQAVARIVEQAQRQSRRVMAVHQFATQAGVTSAVSKVPALGQISRLSFVVASAGGMGLDGSELDAVVEDLIPHPFSVVSRLWPNAELSDLKWRSISPFPGELFTQCDMSGIPFSLSVSMSGRPTRCYMEIQGSGGTVKIDFFHGFATFSEGHVSRMRKITYPLSDGAKILVSASTNLMRRAVQRQYAYPGLLQLFADFYRSLYLNSERVGDYDALIQQARARDLLIKSMREARASAVS